LQTSGHQQRPPTANDNTSSSSRLPPFVSYKNKKKHRAEINMARPWPVYFFIGKNVKGHYYLEYDMLRSMELPLHLCYHVYVRPEHRRVYVEPVSLQTLYWEFGDVSSKVDSLAQACNIQK
jgi:hypothetical protein